MTSQCSRSGISDSLSLLDIEQEASSPVGKHSTSELYPSLQSDLENEHNEHSKPMVLNILKAVTL